MQVAHATMWTRSLIILCAVSEACALVLRAEKIKATQSGVCMYNLPPKFNIHLTNSSFYETEPVSTRIPNLPNALLGLHNTDQFSLDRVFYDRMQLEATHWVEPSKCKIFYIPYFAQWETCHKGKWTPVARHHLDMELLVYLTYMGRYRQPPGADHFLTLSRTERDVAGNRMDTPLTYANNLLNNPKYANVKKLTIETLETLSAHPNVYAVPYPAWFRYEPSLGLAVGKKPPEVVVTSAKFDSQCSQVSALQFMQRSCSGKPVCTFRVPAKVHGCTIRELEGQYKCSDESAETSFKVVAGQAAALGKDTVVLGCGRGPCWLWGNCHKPTGETRTGPLAVFIGHAKHSEWSRRSTIQHCQERPFQCVFLDTGYRPFRMNTDMILKMNNLLTSSVFCMNPPGDTLTRKGLFDSLLAGCIPVIYNPDSLAMYRWYIKDADAVSVVIDASKVTSPNFNVIDHLASLSEAEVQWKQDAIQKLAFKLQYSEQAGAPQNVEQRVDAFQNAMNGLLNGWAL